ncbi:MAG: alpha/beta fold hydrolase [Pseudohaliea sp.]
MIPRKGWIDAAARGRALRAIAAHLVAGVLVAALPGPESHASTADDLLIYSGMVERDYDGQPDGHSHVRVYGPRDATAHGNVVLIPSLGRGVDDFTERYGSTLTHDLAARGFCVVLIQPRGIGRSTMGLPERNRSLSALAGDVRHAMAYLGTTPFHVVGHAFGNRVARSVATRFPESVLSVVLLAAGGQLPLDAEQRASLAAIFDASTAAERSPHVQKAFFAPGNAASSWLQGWHPAAATAQVSAAGTPDVDFKAAGGRPMLVLQPENDFIAPPARAGGLLKRVLGDQVTYVTVPDSGHALLPEKPAFVSRQILDFLAGQQESDAPSPPARGAAIVPGCPASSVTRADQ